MARIPYLTEDDLAPEDRALLKRPITLHRALVNSPGMARAFGTLGGHIRHGSKLDPRLRELAIIQVGYLTRSPYEYSHHCRLGVEQFGVSETDIHAISRDTEEDGAGGFPELEAAALRAAREMVTDLAVSDATFAILEARLERADLVDLVVTIGFYCGVVRILASLQIDVEDGYAKWLERFPLPA